MAVETSYQYVPNRARLDALLKIKEQTKVPVAKLFDYALDRLIKEYEAGKKNVESDLRKYLEPQLRKPM